MIILLQVLLAILFTYTVACLSLTMTWRHDDLYFPQARFWTMCLPFYILRIRGYAGPLPWHLVAPLPRPWALWLHGLYGARTVKPAPVKPNAA